MPAPASVPVTLPEPETTVPPSLWQRYHTSNDMQSEEGLVRQYLPLVKTIVGRLAMTLPSHVDIEELNSVGAIGLIHAIRNFKPGRGASFETFARFRIRGAVLDELRRSDWASRTVRDKTRRIQNAMNEVEQRQGMPGTEKEIAAELNITPQQYDAWLDDVRPTTFVCLDSASSNSEEENRELAEIISDPGQTSPHDAVARRELAALIAERIKAMPEMQRKVLALYYYEDLRLREIAEAYGVTEARICQVHAQAILSIRSYLEKVERNSGAIAVLRK